MSPKSFFIFTLCLSLHRVHSELLFTNKGVDIGVTFSASSETYADEAMSGNSFATTYRTIAVSDSVDRSENSEVPQVSDIPDGFWARYLAFGFVKSTLEPKTIQLITNGDAKALSETVSQSIGNALKKFNRRTEELLEVHQQDFDGQELPKGEEIESAAGLTAVVLVRSKNKSVYKITQNGNSRVAIFRLRPSGNRGGRFWYKPIFFSGPYQGDFDSFSTRDVPTGPASFDPAISEIVACEGDIVFVASDGYFDNVGIGALTYKLNSYVALTQLTLDPKIFEAELSWMESQLTLKAEHGMGLWLGSIMPPTTIGHSTMDEYEVESAGGWFEYLWSPDSAFRRVFSCVWKGGRERIGDVLSGFLSLMSANKDGMTLDWIIAALSGAVEVADDSWWGFFARALWRERTSIKKIITCIWNDRKEKLVAKLKELYPDLDVDRTDIDIKWFENKLREIDNQFEENVAKNEKEHGPDNFDKKKLAKELYEELMENTKKKALDKVKEEAISVLKTAVKKAKDGQFNTDNLELEVGSLVNKVAGREEKNMQNLKKAIAATETQNLVMEGLHKVEPIVDWEQGTYRLFDKEIEFFVPQESKKRARILIDSGKAPARGLMHDMFMRDPFGYVGDDTDQAYALYQQLKKEQQKKGNVKSEKLIRPSELNEEGVQIYYADKDTKAEHIIRYTNAQAKKKLELIQPTQPPKKFNLRGTAIQIEEERRRKQEAIELPIKERQKKRRDSDVIDLAVATSPEELLQLRQSGARRVFEDQINENNEKVNLARYLMTVPKEYGESEELLGARLEFILEGTFQFAVPELRHFAANFKGLDISELFATFAQKISQSTGAMSPYCAQSMIERKDKINCAGGRKDDIALVTSAVLNLKLPNVAFIGETSQALSKNLGKFDAELEERLVDFVRISSGF